MSLSRRELVALLGRTAAAGALWACGGRARVRTAPATDLTELRPALREAVARIRARWPDASGWAAVRTRTRLISGTGARGTATERLVTVTLRAVGADGQLLERVTGDASPTTLAALAAELAALGPGGGRTLDAGTPVDHVARVARDPASLPAADWLAPLDRAVIRSEALGSTRIVWRAAHAIVDDDQRWYVADGVDLVQRAVRVQASITVMAWSGNRPMIGEVVLGRASGLEHLELPDDAIARTADRALELLTPGDVPVSATTVLLDPSVTAALVGAGVGEILTTEAWSRPDLAARSRLGQAVAAPMISIVDDPSAGGFAGYVRDDEGAPAAPTTLIDGGRLTAVLADARGAARTGLPRTGHGRRRLDDGAAAARPSDLVLRGGTAHDDELLAAVGDGLVLEAGDGAYVDPRTWQVVVRAARARRVVGGKLSGHVWGDVELRGTLPALLGATTALGIDGPTATRLDAAPASVTAPALVTRGEVVPRRST